MERRKTSPELIYYCTTDATTTLGDCTCVFVYLCTADAVRTSVYLKINTRTEWVPNAYTVLLRVCVYITYMYLSKRILRDGEQMIVRTLNFKGETTPAEKNPCHGGESMYALVCGEHDLFIIIVGVRASVQRCSLCSGSCRASRVQR
jgi:hypothetical protein